MVRGLDQNRDEYWAVAEVKALQEEVEDQEHNARDSNISKSIGNVPDYKFTFLECKYISYYWHLLYVSGLGQCKHTTACATHTVPTS